MSPLEVSCNCAVAESDQGDGTMHGMEVPTFVHMSNIFCALALSAALLVVQQHPIFLSFHLYLTNTCRDCIIYYETISTIIHSCRALGAK